MKALILAAGLGTRLRPLTESMPKCLVPIAGRPLLDYHLKSLEKFGFDEALINTHYLPELVEKYIAEYKNGGGKIKIKIAYEPELLGSAGTLRANKDFFSGEKNFAVIYADNLTNINYRKLLNFHEKNNSDCTIACYFEPNPAQKGVVVCDASERVTRFVEKPKELPAPSNFANGGIYIFNSAIISSLADSPGLNYDFGHHVFPQLLENKLNLHAYKMDEFLLDIGSMDSYNLAQSYIDKLIF